MDSIFRYHKKNPKYKNVYIKGFLTLYDYTNNIYDDLTSYDSINCNDYYIIQINLRFENEIGETINFFYKLIQNSTPNLNCNKYYDVEINEFIHNDKHFLYDDLRNENEITFIGLNHSLMNRSSSLIEITINKDSAFYDKLNNIYLNNVSLLDNQYNYISIFNLLFRKAKIADLDYLNYHNNE